MIKAADVFSPMSELSRCLHATPPTASPAAKRATDQRRRRPPVFERVLGGYTGALTDSITRTALAGLATLSTLLLFLLAIPGTWLFQARTHATSFHTSLILAGCGATVAASLVVAMTRLRAPFEALLIIPAAVTIIALLDRVPPRTTGRRWAAASVALGSLGLFWFLSIPALVGVFRRLMGES